MTRAIPFWAWLLLLLSFPVATAAAQPSRLAVAPPMGWNSWDAYGFTITENEFRANVRVLAEMRPLGWSTAVIDEGWYMANPLGSDLASRQYHYDGYGRLVPDTSRFWSAVGGKGLKPLADWTHAQGLKFGIHIVRGIPKVAARANLPIAQSSFRASDAALTSDSCPWDDANFGVADNAAGQAWYDSLLAQYASWGIDFLKVDCIADHPYKPTEIRQIAEAIRKSGREIVLSLSPGPTSISHATEVKRYAQMWRIMDDLWDGWIFPHNESGSEFPSGIRNAFERLALWNEYSGTGNWPDADMLPFGALYPHPGWGDPRLSRLSETETRSAFTLWAIARSPLILGGSLTHQPADVASTIANKSVIALDQEDRVSQPLAMRGTSAEIRIWISRRTQGTLDTVAFFNLGEAPATVHVRWAELGFPGGNQTMRDLWTGAALVPAEDSSLTIPPHGVVLLRSCQRAAPC